jgi:cytochrome c2
MSRLLFIISPLVAALALFMVPALRFGEPVWLSQQSVLMLSSMAAIGFLIGYGVLHTPIARTQNLLLNLLRIAAVGAFISLPIILYFLILDINISRVVVLYVLALLFVLLVVNSFNKYHGITLIFNIVALSITVVASNPSANLLSKTSGPKVAFDSTVSYEFANYHDLKLSKTVIFDETLRDELVNGGAISIIDDNHLLLVTGYGKTYLIDKTETKLSVRLLDIQVPINAVTYLDQSTNPTEFFRVTDILLENTDQPIRKLYAAHHYLDTENKCYKLSLSETQIDLRDPIAKPWVTRYSANPCAKVSEVRNTTGGRLAFMQDGSILMTIGDHSFNRDKFALDDNAHWGKMMQLNPLDWSSRIDSQGHRNPQGLLVTSDGVWSTEHGPEGGDELNKIEYGANYGWPFETYGTDYGRKTFRGEVPGKHSRGKRPLYSWVPSIGTSNLIQVEGATFPAWRGDLLVSSLNGRSLFRIRIREDRVVTIERINIGERTRDLVEMPDGTIILWNGQDTLTIMESANYVLSKCTGCHIFQAGSHSLGPDLWKVVGRKTASRSGYSYSKAMREYRGNWTPERLDKFLTNPGQEVPGKSIQFECIADPETRKEIIQLLTNHLSYKADDRR